MKRGISLITLIITIIVIVILASTIVLNLNNTNIINEANNAVFLSNLKANEEAFTLYKASLFIETNGDFDGINLSIVGEDLVYDTNGDGETTPNISKALDEIFPKPEIVESIDGNGNLVQISGENEGNSTSSAIIVNNDTDIFTSNNTLDGNVATSTNPIIPKGFKPVNAVNNVGSIVANWNDLDNNYNKGLVIQDVNENQFVWIPVDRIGTPGEKAEGEVTYNKWCTNNIAYNDVNILDDTLPSGVIDENTQITTYGGFYVARYEAGKESTNTLVSKDDATVWYNINYTDAKSTSESMYNDSNIYGVRSGLLTGKMWDTVLDYLYEYHGKTEEELDFNSSSWGNYDSSSGDADILGHGTLKVTGYSDYWQAGNIYDMAGNLWEWTNEKYSTDDSVARGYDFFSEATASSGYRNDFFASFPLGNISFRLALFI